MDHQQYLSQRRTTNPQQVFELAKKEENEDRACFSQVREGWEVVGREDLSRHPHRSLIPLYDMGTGQVFKESFTIEAPLESDANRQQRVFALNRKEREELTGQCSVVPTLSAFKTTFVEVFCEGELSWMRN
jgi:hypothetical protein